MGAMKNAYRIVVGKSEGKRLRGRPRRRCEDNIRISRKDIGWVDVDWMHVSQGKVQWRAVVNVVIKLRIP
jgi:hypothetical protein